MITNNQQHEREKKDAVKLSAPVAVNAFLQTLDHPLLEVIRALRLIILNNNSQIGDEIKWNAPKFFYTGEMKQFSPKEYRSHVLVFNLFKKHVVRLVFQTGATIIDPSALLEGNYPDARKLALFYSMNDVKEKKQSLQQIIRTWLNLLENKYFPYL